MKRSLFVAVRGWWTLVAVIVHLLTWRGHVVLIVFSVLVLGARRLAWWWALFDVGRWKWWALVGGGGGPSLLFGPSSLFVDGDGEPSSPLCGTPVFLCRRRRVFLLSVRHRFVLVRWRCSSFGCCVAVGDVAPGVCVIMGVGGRNCVGLP